MAPTIPTLTVSPSVCLVHDRGFSIMRPTPVHLSNSLRAVPEEWDTITPRTVPYVRRAPR
ncbi:hypothetical protein GCM10010260_03670 [Streptomyces filipinensis]|uniref:Uncharacterized protein n=1 Tax=Streptomyces filipinensis TaxID=66887 RepID=A0A918M8Z2_9ACTN|nr:hypothetical protein GCM10010260_03670 [Streptomyces filipinensis]